MTRRSTYAAAACYVLSAAAFTVLHVLLTKGEPKLSLFVKSRKHPYYLNGRFLFLALSQFTCASAFLLRHVMIDRFVVRWPPVTIKPATEMEPRPTSVNKPRIALTVVILTLLCIFASAAVFGLTRILLLPVLFRLPLVHLLLRPFATHFLRGPWTISLPWRHLGLLFRTFFLGATMVATWEVSDGLFDLYIAEPVSVSANTADPILTLVSGAQSASAYYQYFAYLELRDLVREDSAAASARRQALFADQKYNPPMWTSFSRASLVQLGKEYQHFLRRGAPVPAPAAPAPAAAPPPKKADPTPPTPLIRKPILKAPPQTPVRAVIDSFASDGTISQAIASTAEVGAAHIPELFRSVSTVAPISTEVVVKEVKEVASAIDKVKFDVKSLPMEVLKAAKGRMGTDGVVGRYTELVYQRYVKEQSGKVKEWWEAERLAKAAEGYLPNRELDILIINVLTALACASLTEDRYGVVQKDLPRIIEAFITFSHAIEEFHRELTAKYPPPMEEELEEMAPEELEARNRIGIDVEGAIATSQPVHDALKEGVAKIARTFGDKLGGFRFPPRIARTLQLFVDYSAVGI